MKPYVAGPPGAVSPVALMNDEALLTAVAMRGEGVEKGQAGTTLLATALLFLALGGLHWGWKMVVYLAVGIALHELGHVLAMRLFGYKNVRMLFVPLFGGLATGVPRELDATKNALVALAGPVFGLMTAGVAGLAAFMLGSPQWLVQFAWVSLLLNAFNLIPFVPLDGGQFANDTLFSRFPALELVFRLVAIAGLGWIAWILQAWLLGGLVGFMLITTPVTYRRARLIREARRDPTWQNRTLDLATVTRLRELVAQVFNTLAREKYEKKLPEHVHGVWLEIHKRFPGPGRTLALLGAYVFTCAIGIPVVTFFLVSCLERPLFE